MILPLLVALACSNPQAVADTPVSQPVKASTSAPTSTSSAIVLTGPRPKNVLMLSIDTLRRDHVSRYGNGASTPFLDRFLSEGLALDRHRSCSNWTLASVACVLSGRDHVSMRYLPEITMGGDPAAAPASIEFADEILARHGYYTGRVTSNNFLKPDYGIGNPPDLVYEARGRAEAISTDGLAMIDRAVASGKPWFVQIHYLDPHSPYFVQGERHPQDGTFDAYAMNPRKIPKDVWNGWSEEERQKLEDATRERYRGEVEYTDRELSQPWQTLESKHVLDDTLVVVWTDHGEQLWERGHISHGYDLNSEESDAVAGFWAKSLRPKAFQGPTVHEDILPTMLSILGLDGEIAREKMTGLVAGTGPANRATFTDDFSGQNTKMGVDQGNQRMIYNWEGRLSWFDLAADPGEKHDKLAGMARTDPENPAFPAEALALWKLLEPRVHALDAIYVGITPVMPGKDPTAEQLAAPRDQRQRGADEMAQGGGGYGRGKASGSGGRRRRF
jgi:arylsulfatase A-like enzyme